MSILDPDALWRYIAIFSTLLAAGFGFPIPEEIPVVTAGVMVARNDILDWWVMVPVCIAGVVIGDMVLYTIGRLWGSRLIVHPWVQRKLITPATRRRIERNFHEYGVGILLAARLMPGVRSPVFIMAGVIRMPWWKFLLADGIYAIPGVNLLFWLAYIFTDQFVELVEKVENVRPLIIVLVLAVATGVLLYYWLRRRVSTGDPMEIPLIGREIAQVAEKLHHHEGAPPPHADKRPRHPYHPHPHHPPHPRRKTPPPGEDGEDPPPKGENGPDSTKEAPPVAAGEAAAREEGGTSERPPEPDGRETAS